MIKYKNKNEQMSGISVISMLVNAIWIKTQHIV